MSNFMAGVGDSMTFGLTSLARKGINAAMYGDWYDPADVSSKSYIAGEVTEVVVEIAVTAGGVTLRHVAKKTIRSSVESGARQAFRRAKGIGRGGVVHHVNPIKGHYNGKQARFPLNTSGEERCWDGIDIVIRVNYDERGSDFPPTGDGPSVRFVEYGRHE